MDLVIFDLDGTLVDTVADLANSVNYALNLKGLSGHSVAEYRLMVGNGVSKLVHRAMPQELQKDLPLHAELLESFIQHYKEHIVDKSALYPGMFDIVSKLKRQGIKIAIASNKFQEGTEAIVKHFFPQVLFDVILGVREGFPLKPDPAVIELILKCTNTKKESAIMVGDSGTDMQTALNMGIMGVGVSWGFRPEDAKKLAKYYVQSPEELSKLLNL